MQRWLLHPRKDKGYIKTWKFQSKLFTILLLTARSNFTINRLCQGIYSIGLILILAMMMGDRSHLLEKVQNQLKISHRQGIRIVKRVTIHYHLNSTKIDQTQNAKPDTLKTRLFLTQTERIL